MGTDVIVSSQSGRSETLRFCTGCGLSTSALSSGGRKSWIEVRQLPLSIASAGALLAVISPRAFTRRSPSDTSDVSAVNCFSKTEASPAWAFLMSVARRSEKSTMMRSK